MSVDLDGDPDVAILDITMPELAAELAEQGTVVVPSSLSRWLIRNGSRVKKNTAGQRARSPRHRKGARSMGNKAPAADAA